MSGLFRYNTNSIKSPVGGGGGGGGSSSGPTSSTPNYSNLSPFKTTPPVGLFGKSSGSNNWLFNAESPHSFNMSSAGGSPDKLKSVNEMERRLDFLEKENLTLRMRLFHQEDWRANAKPGQDLAKEIVDLKVQLATQKETIKEKTDAVVQASKALNYMESVLKKNEKEFDVLKKRISELEGNMANDQHDGATEEKLFGGNDSCATSPEGVNLSDLCKTDTGSVENPMLKTLEDENDCLKKEVQRLQDCVSDMCKQLDTLMNDSSRTDLGKPMVMNSFNSSSSECMEELRAENEKLKRELCETKMNLEGTAKNLECAKQQLIEEKKKAADLICENEEMTERLKKTEKGLRNATKIVEKVMSSSQASKLSCGERSSEQVEEDSVHSSPPSMMFDNSAGGGGDNLACEMRRIIREKNAELLDLRVKMRGEGKTNAAIDKELCSRQEEVKRLTKVLATYEQKCGGNATRDELSQERTARTCDMTTMSGTSSCVAGERGEAAGAINLSPEQVKKLEEELESRRRALDEFEIKTGQMSDTLTVLRLRLEELAGFLKTLLQHKDILGMLCQERVSAMEKAVDRSLNFTNALDVTCGSATGGGGGGGGLAGGKPDDVSFDISKLCRMNDFSLTMNSTADPFNGVIREIMDVPQEGGAECAAGEGAGTGPGAANPPSSTVDALRNEILTLRGELDKAYKKKECDGRKERKSLPCNRANNNSDSEWSGPDLNVSAQRIGIEVAREHAILISSSEEDACGGSTASGKRGLMEKILRYEKEIELRDNQVLEVKLVMVELETELKQEQVNSAELLKKLALFKEKNSILEKNICDFKNQLDDALEELQAAKEEVKCVQARMEREKEEEVKETRQCLTREMEELRRNGECQLAEKDRALQAKTKELEAAVCEKEKREKEVVQVTQKLSEIACQLEKLREKEAQWCQDLMCGEERTKKLRKSLDELTLQATRAAVERTKACNERDKACHEKRELEAKYDCLLEERIKLKDRLFNTDRLNAELCEQLKNSNLKGGKECDATSGYGSEETRPESPERQKHDCGQVDSENQELKRRLAHLKRTLEHTFNKLKMSNQMKEKVERDIQQQLIKTNNVLKIASKNIENRQN